MQSTKVLIIRGFRVMVTIIALVAIQFCGKEGSSGLSPEQKEAIAEAFAYAALSSSTGTVSPQSISLKEQGLLKPLVNCTPDKLTPPYNCPGGGNIYFTINLSCNGPSGCCASQNPCSKDSISINGMGTTSYNSCTTVSSGGDHVVVNGSLTATITSTAEFTCDGIVTASVKVSLTGMPSITVNGKEVCKGDVFITATATVSATMSVSVSGTVCGENIYNTINYGCLVKCADNSCCYSGTYCSTCSDGCIPVGGDDCCNGKYCKPGWTCCSSCYNGGPGCQLGSASLNGLDFIPAMPSFEAVNQ